MSSEPEPRPSRAAFVLAFTSIYLVWGSTYLSIRVAVQTIPPFLMAGARFLLAGAILFLAVRARDRRWPTRRQWRDNFLIGVFLLLGGNGLISLAEQALPSALTALIIAIQPVLMVLTEWAWPGGRRPSGMTALGLVLGFAGVAWLVAPWNSAAGTGVSLAGVGLVLISCVSWSVGSIWSRNLRQAAPPFQAAAMQMLGGSVALLFVAAVRGEFAAFDLSAVSAASYGAFFYLVAFGSLVGFSTFVWLMKHAAPARVATYAYVNPVVAVFLGWLILREPVSPRLLSAAVVIVAAVVIITRQKAREPKKSPARERVDAGPARVVERESAS